MDKFNQVFNSLTKKQATSKPVEQQSVIPGKDLMSYLEQKVKTDPKRVVDMLYDVFTDHNTEEIVNQFYAEIRSDINKK